MPWRRAYCQGKVGQDGADPWAQLVGHRIKQLREDAGLTLEKLAFAAELNKGHLSKLERGLQSPTVATLVAIAEILGVEVFDLLVDPGASDRQELVEATRLLSADQIRELKAMAADLVRKSQSP